MNMFEVWLLLVLIPKSLVIFIPIAVVSVICCVLGVAWGLVSWESVRRVQLEKEIWNKQDDIAQESALNGIKASKKVFKIGVATLLTSSLLIAAVPDKKEMAAIVLIPYVSNNPEFKKLPENIVGILNDLIKEYRKELSPTKEAEHE